MIAGSLEIQMMADMAKLKSDMDAAKSYVANSATAMGNALKAIGVGISVAGITAWIKAGIDAADAAYQISQKTGLATKDVAGLQLAFKTGVGSADGMTASLAKMSKSIVDGSGAYKLLGVNVKNADGTFRSTKDVLYDTADAFAGIKDGAGKTALAIEIFGKSGAEMIPMLNDGAQGLREMAEMAEKLGLVVDDDVGAAANKFNDTLDLLGASTKGMATQIAAQLLPTLNGLAGGFLESMTSGDGLKKTAEFIASALKVLYTVIAGGVQIVSTLGQGFGALGATIAAVLSGNFGQAKTIIGDFMDVAKKDWAATINNIGVAWDGSAAKTAEAGAKIVKQQRDMAQASKDAEAASKAAAAAKQKEAEAYASLTGTLETSLASARAELDNGTKLNAAQAARVKFVEDLDGKYGHLTVTQLVHVDALLHEWEETLKVIEATKERNRLIDEGEKLAQKLAADQEKIVETLRDQNTSLEEENQKLRMGEAAWNMYQRAKLIARAEQIESLLLQTEYNKALADEAAELRRRAAALGDNEQLRASVEAAKTAHAEWSKVSDQIGQGLTDSLYRAFESGKNFFSTLWAGIKNTFKTTTLRLIVDTLMRPVNLALGFIFGGLAGPAQAAGGVGGMLSGLGNLWSGISGAAGSLFGGIGNSAVSLLGNTSMGQGMLSMLGYGGSGIAGGLGAGAGAFLEANGVMTAGEMAAGSALGGLGALGSVMPYLGAAALIASAFAHKPTHHEGSVVFADSSGARTDPGRDFLGVLQHQNSGTDAALRTMGGGIVNTLNTLSGAFGGGGGFAAALQFAADNDDASFGIFDLLRNGTRVGGTAKTQGGNRKDYASDPAQGFAEFGADVGRAVRSAIDTIDLPQWARDALSALGTDPSLDRLTEAANAIVLTRQQLTGLGDALAPMGGIFARMAALGDEAKLSLAGMVGGLDQLVAKSQSFVQAYYSEGEQAGIAARSILEQVQRAGVSSDTFDMIAGLGSKSEFRGLFESINLGTDFGLKMAGLGLNIGTQFAGIANYLEANDLTLGALASSGVDPAVLKLLNTATDTAAADAASATAEATATTAEAATETATATKATAEAMAEATDKLAEIVANTAATVTAVQAGLVDVVAMLTEIRDRSAAMLAEQQLLALAGTEPPGNAGG